MAFASGYRTGAHLGSADNSDCLEVRSVDTNAAVPRAALDEDIVFPNRYGNRDMRQMGSRQMKSCLE